MEGGGGGAFAWSSEAVSADVRVMFVCTCGGTDSLGLQEEGEDFLFVGGWEGGGEDVVSALAFGSRRLVPFSSRMSMRSSSE